MVELIVKGGASLYGSIRAPSSKAHTHRAIIASSLSRGESMIYSALLCDDTMATINACRMLGADVEIIISDKCDIRVKGLPKPKTPENVIDCGDSGSTIRFITPVCALTNGISVLTGGESLRRRPMGPLLDALSQLGVKCYSARGDGRPPIIVFGGGIRGGRAEIRGDVSSQFISGLLFATPMANNDTYINLLTPLESKPYVDITLNILEKHGIEVIPFEDQFYVPCGQEYKSYSHVIEGDYSSASFLLAAAAITRSSVMVENLLKDTLQGDRRIINILSDMGVMVNCGADYVEVKGVDGDLRPISIDMRDNPDLVPVCTALACFAKGKTTINGIRRLRFKESDRAKALLSELGKMGALIRVLNDSLVIEGEGRLHGAIIDSHKDHRIIMACTIAALGAEGETIIRDAEYISKSYPNFIRDMRLLGAEIIER
ncbi:MAG: 3-phosphoshikimate 1-carboxyvinyltransferase [Candidatus Bathyarchaeia archaeon]|nr:3-phosphoshikimate 1-carboxyvinyltransferase [Candidatus Bathyarchaeota archaeon]